MSRTFRRVSYRPLRHPRHHQRLVIEGGRGNGLPEAIRAGNWADITPFAHFQLDYADSGLFGAYGAPSPEERRAYHARSLRLIRRRQSKQASLGQEYRQEASVSAQSTRLFEKYRLGDQDDKSLFHLTQKAILRGINPFDRTSDELARLLDNLDSQDEPEPKPEPERIPTPSSLWFEMTEDRTTDQEAYGFLVKFHEGMDLSPLKARITEVIEAYAEEAAFDLWGEAPEPEEEAEAEMLGEWEAAMQANDDYQPWLDAQPRCALCGELLSECHVGPCPWGSEEPYVVMEDGSLIPARKGTEDSPYILEDWTVVWKNVDAYAAPELATPHLKGKVFGHSDFDEGEEIVTSVISMTEHVVWGENITTHSGTVYRLGQKAEMAKENVEMEEVNVVVTLSAEDEAEMAQIEQRLDDLLSMKKGDLMNLALAANVAVKSRMTKVDLAKAIVWAEDAFKEEARAPVETPAILDLTIDEMAVRWWTPAEMAERFGVSIDPLKGEERVAAPEDATFAFVNEAKRPFTQRTFALAKWISGGWMATCLPVSKQDRKPIVDFPALA